MIETLVTALLELFSLAHLFHLLAGVLLGLTVGILPGLGGIAGLSLLMPFIYGMDTTSALAMTIGLLAVTTTSDTFTCVLMGIPGTSSSQATVLDGFALAKQGQATRALSAAFVASLFGGVFGAAVLTVSMLLARPIILAFGSGELFMLALFGLSMVCTLAGRSLIKGICAGVLGLVLGGIGAAPATGEFRMVAGIDYLYDGVPLVVVALGLFAVPEVVTFLRRDQSITGGARLQPGGWLSGLKDWWANRFLSARCAGIGCTVGAIPGLGGTVVDWIAYGHAVQTTRKEPRFGTGDIRGVIAPESANNAKDGGALLPTLLFGIPGSGSMAVFLGAMVLIGIEPGPSMVTTHLDLTYTIVWSLALANVVGAAICFILANPIARLTQVPYEKLAPFMMVLVCFSAFQETRDLADLLALLLLGAVGILMRRFGWPRPALLIGYVLAPQAEAYLYQSIQFYGSTFLLRPGVLIIAALIALSVYYGLRNRVEDIDDIARPERGLDVSRASATMKARAPQVIFAALCFLCFVYTAWDASRHTFLGAVFPATFGVLGAVAALCLLCILVLGSSSSTAIYDHEIDGDHVGDDSVRSAWSGYLWLAVPIVLTAFFGFFVALIGFFTAFLRFRASADWRQTLLLTMLAAGLMLVIAWALTLNFPRGLLQHWFELPWPLR